MGRKDSVRDEKRNVTGLMSDVLWRAFEVLKACQYVAFEFLLV